MDISAETLLAGWESVQNGITCCTEDGRIIVDNHAGMDFRARRGVLGLANDTLLRLAAKDSPRGFNDVAVAGWFGKKNTRAEMRLYFQRRISPCLKVRRPVPTGKVCQVHLALGKK